MGSDSKVVFVTGTSTGFGKYLALASLEAGLKVIATARNLASIANLAKACATIMQLDVTIPAEDINAVAAKAIAVYGHVDYLINNAGRTALRTVEETSTSSYRDYFETNFWGALKITKAFLPHFRERKTGTMVQISTQTTELGLAGLSAYSSSKAALNAISDVLAAEVKPFGIRVISIQPGSFRTPIMTTAGPGSSDLYPEMAQAFDFYASLAGTEPGDPEKGAKRIVEVMQKEGALPDRLAFGEMAVGMTGAKFLQRSKTLDEWKEYSVGVDMDKA